MLLRWAICLLVLSWFLLSGNGLSASEGEVNGKSQVSWDSIPSIAIDGSYLLYWNVNDFSRGANESRAVEKGFKTVRLVNTFSGAGQNRMRILDHIRSNRGRPELRPDEFEGVVRSNIEVNRPKDIYVHDIEFEFDRKRPINLQDSQLSSSRRAISETDYLKKWGGWFSDPLVWSKGIYPRVPTGIYGPQIVRDSYHGFEIKSRSDFLKETHSDRLIWAVIDPHVDFYLASVYIPYDRPDAIFYVASNIEENVIAGRGFRDLPLYAYVWLRFHDWNKDLKNRLLGDELVEAVALLPVFSGAKGTVLWGYEPSVTIEDASYSNLSHFISSINRLASIGPLLKGATVDLSYGRAADLWRERRVYIRRLVLGQDDCLFALINPWLQLGGVSEHQIECGGKRHTVALNSRRISLIRLRKDELEIL